MLAYTTGMASLTEFYTLTLWEKETDMMAFMSSDDHRDMMWNVRRWSDSFWSMRWQATGDEVGSWDGTSFGQDDVAAGKKSPYIGPGYLESHEVPEALQPYLLNIIRKTEPETLSVDAVIGRIPTPSPLSMRLLKRTVQPWRSSSHALRFELAFGLGECLLFVVWKGQGKKNSRELLDAVTRNFPDAWAMRFPATDFEIGHWNQLRIREYAAPDPNVTAAE